MSSLLARTRERSEIAYSKIFYIRIDTMLDGECQVRLTDSFKIVTKTLLYYMKTKVLSPTSAFSQ